MPTDAVFWEPTGGLYDRRDPEPRRPQAPRRPQGDIDRRRDCGPGQSLAAHVRAAGAELKDGDARARLARHLLHPARADERAAAGREPLPRWRHARHAAAAPHVRGAGFPLPRPLRIGQALRQETELTDISAEDRRHRHDGSDRGEPHLRPDGLAVEDERRIVYREEVKPASAIRRRGASRARPTRPGGAR